jgi:hypothetical protein
MSNPQQRSTSARVLKRSAIAGFIIGALLATTVFVFEFVFPIWIPVMAPPEKAVKLLTYHNNGFDDNTLYVRTESGSVYAFRVASFGASDIEWKKAEQTYPEANDYECNFGKFPTPNPPGKIVSQLESHPCVVDSSNQVNYIILEDGSIWRWGKSVPEFEEYWALFGLAMCVFFGGGLGVLGGFFLGLAIVRFKKI